MTSTITDEEETRPRRYNPLINPTHTRPILINEHTNDKTHIFLTRPLLGPLVFENVSSDARDHCANERTFLSWLRLAMYLAIVSMAIIISFHFKSQPTRLERKMALPLGLVFWLLSLACLANGFANYVVTVRKYSRKAALVQAGWKTQIVFTVVAVAILGSCVLFLSTDQS
ncbi:hypothetical protein ASPZODRAFT_134425 [Penicilliopsis zonata CBS 506.65]|uniref:DUF202 domain-containing protein n=1 Tax=Penicilliopsis zonata CBS 506.65 TaxID=1073090 RepID=A0A1L9SCW8_9EURO|nr:hypothetical protein ASPZODRAFT_134425 [Penicilliopsis zonata CBS 506.65]OJJ44999.1 hypothetical protein ASPZODRAFT_134425 [Penicilliopsis zonata CBS 506.65]